MAYDPSKWAAGLAPVAVLWVLGTIGALHDVERDLSGAVKTALRDEVEGPQAKVRGRDVKITGGAFTKADQKAAGETAYVSGVRRLDASALGLVPAVGPYEWWIVRNGDRVTISGASPNPQTQAKIAAAAKIAGVADVFDRTTFARGQSSALPAAGVYAASLLAHLPNGAVTFSDGAIEVSGTAADPAAYARVLGMLKAPPEGVKIASAEVTPPLVSPYVFAAEKAGDLVKLQGYAPSEADKAALAARASRAFPGAKIDNGVALASGASGGASAAAFWAMDALAKLSAGKAEVKDSAISVSGPAAEPGAIEALAALSATAPGGFTLSLDKVTPPTAQTYAFAAMRDADGLHLTGFTPNAAAHAKLLAAAGALKLPVEDHTRIATGLPAGISFEALTRFALGELSKLDAGKVKFAAGKIDVTGRTLDWKAGAAAQDLLKATPVGTTLGEVALERPPTPDELAAEREAKRKAAEAAKIAAAEAAARAEEERKIEQTKALNDATAAAQAASAKVLALQERLDLLTKKAEADQAASIKALDGARVAALALIAQSLNKAEQAAASADAAAKAAEVAGQKAAADIDAQVKQAQASLLAADQPRKEEAAKDLDALHKAGEEALAHVGEEVAKAAKAAGDAQAQLTGLLAQAETAAKASAATAAEAADHAREAGQAAETAAANVTAAASSAKAAADSATTAQAASAETAQAVKKAEDAGKAAAEAEAALSPKIDETVKATAEQAAKAQAAADAAKAASAEIGAKVEASAIAAAASAVAAAEAVKKAEDAAKAPVGMLSAPKVDEAATDQVAKAEAAAKAAAESLAAAQQAAEAANAADADAGAKVKAASDEVAKAVAEPLGRAEAAAKAAAESVAAAQQAAEAAKAADADAGAKVKAASDEVAKAVAEPAGRAEAAAKAAAAAQQAAEAAKAVSAETGAKVEASAVAAAASAAAALEAVKTAGDASKAEAAAQAATQAQDAAKAITAIAETGAKAAASAAAAEEAAKKAEDAAKAGAEGAGKAEAAAKAAADSAAAAQAAAKDTGASAVSKAEEAAKAAATVVVAGASVKAVEAATAAEAARDEGKAQAAKALEAAKAAAESVIAAQQAAESASEAGKAEAEKAAASAKAAHESAQAVEVATSDALENLGKMLKTAPPAPTPTPSPTPAPSEDSAPPTQADINANTKLTPPRCEAYMLFLLDHASIQFGLGKAGVSAASAALLGQIAHVANRCLEAKLEIAGYTDNIGDAAANKRLSQARANAVAAALTRAGVAANRMTATGHGADNPIAPNTTDEGRAKNRRIEVHVRTP